MTTPLVYVVSSVDRVIKTGCRWSATDGNAAAAISSFSDQVEDLPELVDWSLMALPVTSLAGCAVRTDRRQQQVRSLLAGTEYADLYVGVRAEWYYGYAQGGGQR